MNKIKINIYCFTSEINAETRQPYIEIGISAINGKNQQKSVTTGLKFTVTSNR